MVTVAVRFPAAVGVNVTFVLHVANAVNLVGEIGQPLDMVKSPGLVPPSTTLEIVKAVLFVFSNVIDWSGLVKLMVSLGKNNALCSNKAEVADATPKPVTFTVCVPRLSLTLTWAVRLPVAPGVNATSKLHVVPVASDPVQLLLLTVKSPGLAPAVVTPRPVTVAPELFITWTN